MENFLIKEIKRFISPTLISSLGVSANETESSINNAFDLAIPALLLKMKDKGTAYVSELFTQVETMLANQDAEIDFKINKASDMLDGLLGSDKSTVVNSIAQTSNVSQTSALTVLNTAFLSIVDYFKNLDGSLDAFSFSKIVDEHATSLKGLLPVGLLSISSFANQSTQTPQSSHTNESINTVVNQNEKDQFKTNESPYKKTENDKSGNSLKYILLPLLLGIVLIFLLYRKCNKEQVVTNTTNDTLVIQPNENDNSTRTTKEIIVTDGVILNGYTDGIEDKLIAFLNEGRYKKMTEDQLKDVWFNFDNLNFEHGTANVVLESQVQLQNIAAILKAYPNVKVKIGGYTDKTGDETINKKISTERALAVKQFLDNNGLGSQVVGAEGYGSEFAVYSESDSEELRLTDRKVALSVRN